MEIRNPVVDVRLPVMFLYIVCLSTYWTRGGAQSCLTCIPSQCTVDGSACPYGFAKDYCGCCDECLKGPGEKCGGFFGKCAEGSHCYVKLDFGISYILYVQTPGICEEINPTSQIIPSPTYSITFPSSCSPVTITTTVTPVISSATSLSASSSSLSFSTSPKPSPPPPTVKCRPPCSKELCWDGRNRYCSSNSTTSSSRNFVKERTPCQHTTCLACRYHVKPDCSACPVPVNKRSLRHFHLCLSEHYQRTNIFLEMNDPRVHTMDGDIICDVPQVEEPEDDGSGDTS